MLDDQFGVVEAGVGGDPDKGDGTIEGLEDRLELRHFRHAWRTGAREEIHDQWRTGVGGEVRCGSVEGREVDVDIGSDRVVVLEVFERYRLIGEPGDVVAASAGAHEHHQAGDAKDDGATDRTKGGGIRHGKLRGKR